MTDKEEKPRDFYVDQNGRLNAKPAFTAMGAEIDCYGFVVPFYNLLFGNVDSEKIDDLAEKIVCGIINLPRGVN